MKDSLEVTVARIDTTVADMHGRLFGNGQPGEIEKLRSRVASLELSRRWALGLSAGVSFCIGTILTWLKMK